MANQKIIPNLWFNGNADEAVAYYLSIFKDGRIIEKQHYPKSKEEGLADSHTDMAGRVQFISFEVKGMQFCALNDIAGLQFNESISLMILCKDQAEIDYYWDALTANGGQESVCGWLKDKYGLSWQVSPENWEELMKNPNYFQKLMGMKKIIISEF